MSGQLLVEVRGLTRTYPAQGGPLAAIEDVQLMLSPGERLAVVGPSGSGKSTLLRILAGLERPSSGRARVAGHDLNARWGRRPGRQVRLVGRRPEARLWPALTVGEHLGLAAADAGHGTAAGDLLTALGLRGRERARPAELSMGERRCLALATALATRPRLLLVDDPLAGLGEADACQVRARFDEALAGLETALVVAARSDRSTPRVDRVVELPASRLVLSEPRKRRQTRPAAGGRPALVAQAAGTRWDRGTPQVLVSFEVREGEMVVVAGGSWTERAALAALCAQRERPTAGRVVIGGVAPGDPWPRVGWLAAEREPSPLTVADAAALAARLTGASRGEAERLVRMVLKATGLERHAATPVDRLCAWEERCAALASALAGVPLLIVAVEPTDGLDAGTAGCVLAGLREAADSGIAVLLTAREAPAADVADRVLTLHDGSLHEVRP